MSWSVAGVAGGGRCGRWWSVAAVGWVKRAPSAPRKQAPIARNPSNERCVVADPDKNWGAVRWVTRVRQPCSSRRPDALHPSYEPSSHPIRHGHGIRAVITSNTARARNTRRHHIQYGTGMEYAPSSNPIRHGHGICAVITSITARAWNMCRRHIQYGTGMEYVPSSHPIPHGHGIRAVITSNTARAWNTCRRHINDNGIAPSRSAGVSPGGLLTCQPCVSVGDA